MIAGAILITALAASSFGPPVVLENNWLRVEVQPEVCAVRFIGTRDGVNFVEPLAVRETDLRTGVPVDPGGLTWSIIPDTRAQDDVRAGKAALVSSDARRATMRVAGDGRQAPELQIEIALAADAPKLTLETTLLAFTSEPLPHAVRLLWQLPPGAVVQYPEAVDAQRRQPVYAAAAPSADTPDDGVWTGTTEAIAVSHGRHTLRRRWESMPPYRHSHNVVQVFDSWTQTSGIAVESGWRGISIGAPLTHREVWTLELQVE